MKKYCFAMLLAAAALPPATALAASRSYTYLDAGYAKQSIESADSDPLLRLDDIEADGGYVGGSVELGRGMFLTGGFHRGNGDVDVSSGPQLLTRLDVDVQQVAVGLGYHYEINDRLDWTAELGYLNTRFEYENRALLFTEKQDGDDLRASIGLRGNVSDRLEAWGKLRYTDGDTYDGEASGAVGALLKFNEMWGLAAEAGAGAGNRQYTVGVRASF
ncbi:outer membrane beta-barrel protein [Lysobacter sp. CA196]|uniref:outer membrane beta-barrel protein n=1 Tax=Lysobacter sp. CA196 TaxID=3455606 RepID=UPI003F8D4C74